MRKKYLLFFLVAFNLMSCLPVKILNSTTYIKANDEFILGNNIHGKFYADVTNASNFDLIIWQYPNDGGRHSPLTLKPSMSTKVNVDENTSLRRTLTEAGKNELARFNWDNSAQICSRFITQLAKD